MTTTPALDASLETPTRSRQAKRRVFMALLRILPFSAKLWIARHLTPNLVRYLPGGRSVVVPSYAGRYRMQLSTDFPIETMMIVDNYEPVTRLLVERLVQPGNICADVGANIGGIAFLMAAHVTPGGRVFAFEPSPMTCARLRRNIGLNPGLSDVVVPIQAGLSDRPGELRVVEDYVVPGNASLDSAGGAAVPITTLDRVMFERKVPRLDFLKIDVEGMEFEVLLGARESLATSGPLVYFETLLQGDDSLGASRFARIQHLLQSHGYELFAVNRAGAMTPATVDAHADNTLAVPAARVSEVRERLASTRRT